MANATNNGKCRVCEFDRNGFGKAHIHDNSSLSYAYLSKHSDGQISLIISAHIPLKDNIHGTATVGVKGIKHCPECGKEF